MTESRHFELAAGILSYDQARLVQDTWYVVVPGDLDNFHDSILKPDEVRATVQRFVERDVLIDWLPEMRHLQNEQLLVNEDRLDRARSVLILLRDYSENLN